MNTNDSNNLDQVFKKYGGAMYVKYDQEISRCKSICLASYKKLRSSERVYIDELLTAAPEIYKSILSYIPVFMSYKDNMTLENGIKLVKIATKVLKNKKTISFLRKYIALYAGVINNPKRIKAYSTYLRCVLAHVDPKYKAMIVEVFKLANAFLSVVLCDDILAFFKDVSRNVKKYLVVPLYSEIKK